jgi:hypothetical protein
MVVLRISVMVDLTAPYPWAISASKLLHADPEFVAQNLIGLHLLGRLSASFSVDDLNRGSASQ